MVDLSWFDPAELSSHELGMEPPQTEAVSFIVLVAGNIQSAKVSHDR